MLDLPADQSSALGQMITDSESGNAEAAMQAMLKMKKLDIAQLQSAYRSR
jgi:predicted 3-demethylubiquinone-9 3-methyltransferase (glyoxalase superfamily)